MTGRIFADWQPVFGERGLETRPCAGKRPLPKNWRVSEAQLPNGTIDEWLQSYPNADIGLLTGTSLADGTRIGALDIDLDSFVDLSKELLCNPVCSRFGSKGIVHFVRYVPELTGRRKFKIKGLAERPDRSVGEFLMDGDFCVLPPSIHPVTGKPYQWIGTPLHQVDLNTLPLIGE